MILFIILLLSVWKEYSSSLHYDIRRIVGYRCAFIAIMIQQSFSLGLFGGKGIFSFLAWILLCGIVPYKDQENKDYQIIE